jgi:hypothetical protein
MRRFRADTLAARSAGQERKAVTSKWVVLWATVPTTGSPIRFEGFCTDPPGPPDSPDSPGSGYRLVCRLRDQDEEHAVPLEAMPPRADDTRWWFTASIDVDVDPPLSPGTWDLYVRKHGATEAKPPRVAFPTGSPVGTTHVFPLARGAQHDIRPYVTVKGNVSLTVRALKAYAEVDTIWSREDGITMSGRLMNVPRAGTGAEMVLRDRLSDDVLTIPASLVNDQFEVRVDLDPLSGLHRPDKQVWDLWLRVDGVSDELRLGSHLDDIKDKKKVMTYPAPTSYEGDRKRRIRPYYTVENNVAMTSNRVPLDADAPAPAPAPVVAGEDAPS